MLLTNELAPAKLGGVSTDDVSEILDYTQKIRNIVDGATILQHFDIANRMVGLMIERWKLITRKKTSDPYVTALDEYIAAGRERFIRSKGHVN